MASAEGIGVKGTLVSYSLMLLGTIVGSAFVLMAGLRHARARLQAVTNEDGQAEQGATPVKQQGASMLKTKPYAQLDERSEIGALA